MRVLAGISSFIIAMCLDEHHFVCMDWGDGHQSAFHGDWLFTHKYDAGGDVTHHRLPVDAYKTSTPFQRRPAGSSIHLPKFAYDDVMHSEEALLQWLECLVR